MSDFFKRLLGINKNEYLNRPPRIPEKSLQHIRLKLVSPKKNHCDCNLFNLSTSGLAFYKTPCLGDLVLNTNLDGSLYFHEEKTHDLTLSLVHSSADYFGCRILNQNDQFNRFISNYFKSELAALKLIRVNSENLSPDPDGTPHWYHGSNNCEFYFIEKDRKLVKGHISIFGNYIEMKADGNFLVGAINDGELDPSWKMANTINLSDHFTESLRDSAIRFILNVPDLDNKIRYYIVEKMEQIKA